MQYLTLRRFGEARLALTVKARGYEFLQLTRDNGQIRKVFENLSCLAHRSVDAPEILTTALLSLLYSISHAKTGIVVEAMLYIRLKLEMKTLDIFYFLWYTNLKTLQKSLNQAKAN